MKHLLSFDLLYNEYIIKHKTKKQISQEQGISYNQLTYLFFVYHIRKRLPGKKSFDLFVEQAKKIHGNKYNYDQVKYEGNNVKVKIWCNTCKEFFYQAPRIHLCGKGCKKCGKKQWLLKHYMGLSNFIKKARTIHGNKYDYSQINYINSYTKVCIHCNQCNNDFLQDPHSHLRRKGCPYCRQSKGETQVKVWLDLRGIKYKTQYRFNNCRNKNPLPFDFYLPDYNACIEFQGQQHYLSAMQTNLAKSEVIGKQEFKNLQQRDQIKRNFCKENNIQLLEIKYNEKVNKKLENFFKKLYD